ncbi:MAG TPA: P-loop NTPase fold protein, partial [Blastocatellia bacterium]
MADNRDHLNCLLDTQINSDDDDAFGHRHFAAALKSLIESPCNKPPYTIGLLGKWGTGKSSIKQLYLQPLEDAKKKAVMAKHRGIRRKIAAALRSVFGRKGPAEPTTPEDGIYCITFNAWRFGGENIKRALLRDVFIKLGGDEQSINDALFRQVQRQEREARSASSMLREAYDKWPWALAQILIVFGCVIGGLFIIRGQTTASAEWVSGAIVTILVISGTAITKALLDPRQFVISRYTNFTRVESPRSSSEEYEDLLIYQLKNFKASKRGKKIERIVIFVDDLDRLSAEEMVSGLDAIRTFMEMPGDRLPQQVGMIFVVSCDEDRVADALAARSRTAGDGDSNHKVLILGDARRFLDRIFQFRLEIPPFPKQDMRAYALKKLRKELKPISEALEAQQVSLEDLVDRMIPVSVQSPRNALHILNAFVQGWWLASEREAVPDDRRGGLPK